MIARGSTIGTGDGGCFCNASPVGIVYHSCQAFANRVDWPVSGRTAIIYRIMATIMITASSGPR